MTNTECITAQQQLTNCIKIIDKSTFIGKLFVYKNGDKTRPFVIKDVNIATLFKVSGENFEVTIDIYITSTNGVIYLLSETIIDWENNWKPHL